MTNDRNAIKTARSRLNALIALGPVVPDDSYIPIVNEARQNYHSYRMVPLEIFRAVVIVLLLVSIIVVFALRMSIEEKV